MSDRRSSATAAAVLLGVTVVFYWKILLTNQFSLLTGYEGANQAYAWLNFWVRTIKQGGLPLWDPDTYSGHVFAGEMQTGAFYPLYLPLALFRLNRFGLLAPSLYHAMYAVSHFLGAWFMYRLVRELELGVFPGILAGICFSLGGVLGRLPEWPHLLNSGIWLPLIFLFLLRSMKAPDTWRAVMHASAAGLSLGMSILAGGLHMAVMQTVVIVTAVTFRSFQTKAWRRSALIIGMTGLVAFAAGAVQLLPSMEYSHQALRYLSGTSVAASERIPYRYLSDRLYAHGIFNLLFAVPRSEVGFGETINPYLGVFPLLLAGIGIWKKWRCPWVPYLTALAVAAFAYALGPASLLHGILYALTPYLWLAHEADRFVYLADFALATLAAYGLHALFHLPASEWHALRRILRWVCGAAVAALAVPMVYPQPVLNPWVSLSLWFIILSWLLFRSVAGGWTGTGARVLIVAFILFDLSAFDFSEADRGEMSARGQNEMERLVSGAGAARFLKSQPGLFRVQVAGNHAPNLGDAFAVQATGGSGVTLATAYSQFNGHTDLLNVRYIVRPAGTPDAGAVYADVAWKIYANPLAYPRGWLVHETIVEPNPFELARRLDLPATDAHQVALLPAGLDVALDQAAAAAGEQVHFDNYEDNGIQLTVQTTGRALLVLSELYYPGWTATVNGQPARIWKVDGALRGVVVPRGESRVSLRFRPVSFYIGGPLTVGAFLFVLIAAAVVRRRAMLPTRRVVV